MEVKIWSLCSVSSTLSHANLEQPFRTLAIKWQVNIFVKKSSCIFVYAFSFLHLNCYCVRRLFMHLSLMLCRCDAEWWCRWPYNTMSPGLLVNTPMNNSDNENPNLKHNIISSISTWHISTNHLKKKTLRIIGEVTV